MFVAKLYLLIIFMFAGKDTQFMRRILAVLSFNLPNANRR